jgi:citrate lyase subunit beta/citryl-CoA lyase
MLAGSLRSWMFVPGISERFLVKAAACPADAVFLDLEDGVLPEEKPLARTRVRDALQRTDFHPARLVRINSVASGLHVDDITAVTVSGLAGVCLPKADTAADVQAVDDLLSSAEAAAGLPGGSISIVAAIESALGLMNAFAVASASPRVAGLIFGAEDFALDLGLDTGREGEAGELLYPRASMIISARAAGVFSIDGVYPMLDDPDGMRSDALTARRLGFTGKSTFNPRQLDEINEIFSPSDSQIDYARRVVASWQDAASQGEASTTVDGQLVDAPIVRRAERVLAAAASHADGHTTTEATRSA